MIFSYLTSGFEIATPAVKIHLIHPETRAKESGIARLDFGADITTIPFEKLDKLRLNAVGKTLTAGYNDPGEVHYLFTCTLRLRSLTFHDVDVIAASTPHILLGLDILNTLHICLDGEQKKFEIIEKRKSSRARSRR